MHDYNLEETEETEEIEEKQKIEIEKLDEND